MRIPHFSSPAICSAIFLSLLAAAFTATAQEEDLPYDKIDLSTAFLPTIELAPFEVQGQELSISVYARSKSDRRYAERFAESVIEAAYQTTENAIGNGLVIVGDEGEPHPVFIFRKFLAMAEQNQLGSELTPAATELDTMLNNWGKMVDIEDDADDGINIEFDDIVNAFPLPLEGVASKLYLLAWSEGFDEKRIEQKLESLTTADLETNSLSKYDWVFYLPPRNAFDKVLKNLLPAIMKGAKLGFFKRTALRAAIVTFKPLIRDGIEGARKGMLFLTVLRAVSEYSEEDIEALTEAYMGALMPHGKIIPGKKRQRALDAIEAQKIKNLEYAKDPYISPKPLSDPDLNLYSKFKVEFGRGKKTTHRFTIKNDVCYWQYLDWEPGIFLPAGDSLFVNEKGDMTIEFQLDGEGTVTAVEERWVRRRNTIPRKW